MPQSQQKEVVALAKEILAYLAAYPMAADSVKGISNWWLRSRHAEHSEQVVEQALEYLIRRGLVKRQRSADGTSIYSRAGTRPTGPGQADHTRAPAREADPNQGKGKP